MIEKLVAAHAAGRLAFYGVLASLVDLTAFTVYLVPLKFAGPKIGSPWGAKRPRTRHPNF
jgi:hypothetical protein